MTNRMRFVVALFFLLSPTLAAAQTYCAFYPHGGPICEPPGNPLRVTCPLCAVPSYPRLNSDGQQQALKQAIKEIKETATVVQETYKNISDVTQDMWGRAGQEDDMASDELLRGIVYPQYLQQYYPNPDVDPEADMGTIAQQIADSQFAAPSAVIIDQLALRRKREQIFGKQVLYSNAIALHTKSVTQTTQFGPAVGDQVGELLRQQVRDAIQENNVRALLAARGATLRAIYAMQNRQMGVLATMLTTESLEKFQNGGVDMKPPRFASADSENSAIQLASKDQKQPRTAMRLASDEPIEYTGESSVAFPKNAVMAQAQGGSGGGDSTYPVMQRLYQVQDSLSSARLAIPTQTPGINVPTGFTPDAQLAEMQALNFKLPAQKEEREAYKNSVLSRAIMIEKMHNQRLLAKLNINAIQHMDDTIACHEFSKTQLERVRQLIVPRLRLVAGRFGGFPWGGGSPATTIGAYTQTAAPWTHPSYPAQKTNLDLAFEAIAGRPASDYHYVPETQQCSEHYEATDPGVTGRLLTYDTTRFEDYITRHRSAAVAGCMVADLMMRGTQAPNPRMFTTTCTPRMVRDSEGSSDMTYCLEDNNRQVLAPLIIPNRPDLSTEDEIDDIVPGNYRSPMGSVGAQCLQRVRMSRYAVNDTATIINGITVTHPDGSYTVQSNYYTAANPGPPIGLLGKWLQAYKIERYWADNRYGKLAANQPPSGCQMAYLGSEIFKRRAQAKLADIGQKHNEIIKALRDADGRSQVAAGQDDNPLTAIDLSTPEGRWESMQIQQAEATKLEADLNEKLQRIAQYEQDRASIQLPAGAPAEVHRQWDANVQNMESVKAQILADIQHIRHFKDLASDVVDERLGAGDPNFDYRNNFCYIFHEPRIVNINVEDGVQTVVDPPTGLSYEAPITNPNVEVQQKKCVNLKPLVINCNGVPGPPPADTTIYLTPGVVDN